MKDTIYREDAIKATWQEPTYADPLNILTEVRDRIEAIPSADRPQGDSVSKRYLLAEIDDLADEFSEVDENGLHSERWCGIVDAKLIIMNAPSVSDRPQGEWIDAEIPLESGGSMPIQVCNLCKTFYPLAYTGGGHRFCPNCGARMFAKDTNVPNKKGADDEDN